MTLADIVCVQGLTADKRLPPPGTYEYHNRSGYPGGLAAATAAARDFAVPRISGSGTPCVLRDGRPVG